MHLCLCLVRDTADVRQASPAFRVIELAVAGSLLFLAQNSLVNSRNTSVILDVSHDIFLGVGETVADEICFHSPCAFNTSKISP